MLTSESSDLSVLHLFQLADSALPVGSMSHSFGLETLVFDEDIDSSVQGCPASLSWYLEDALSESLLVDAVFCREAHGRATDQLRGIEVGRLEDLNRQLSALRPARESRDASMAMGRRFAALASALNPCQAMSRLTSAEELHHAVAFGSVLGILSVDAEFSVSAFVHQSVLTLISAAQRLLPLGQVQASRIAWDLKPAILEAVKRSAEIPYSAVCSFAHLPELASMRHPCLPTRLFIS